MLLHQLLSSSRGRRSEVCVALLPYCPGLDQSAPCCPWLLERWEAGLSVWNRSVAGASTSQGFQASHNIHFNPHIGGVLGDVDHFVEGHIRSVGWNGVVSSLLVLSVSIRVEGHSKHVIVGERSFVATSADLHSNRHVGTSHDVGHAVEVEARDAV